MCQHRHTAACERAAHAITPRTQPQSYSGGRRRRSTVTSGQRRHRGGQVVPPGLCRSGSPTVVLVHGLGGSTADWGPVLVGIDEVTHACAVDRIGAGDSFPSPWTRTTGAIVDDLHAFSTRPKPDPGRARRHSIAGFDLGSMRPIPGGRRGYGLRRPFGSRPACRVFRRASTAEPDRGSRIRDIRLNFGTAGPTTASDTTSLRRRPTWRL